ncbi:MAG: enoyl-CoA hydratase/isomerase family protein [Acidobacteria bacterium]|nr:enoyl-CoA hydratase/isomerase family protein [Acidobacteriota bacterium]
MNESIRLSCDGAIASLTIDRPPLNILDIATLGELDRALTSLTADEGIQLLILRGAGPKAFSAGVAVQDHTAEKIDSMLESFHAGLRRLLDFPAPTLAVIDGHCLGGGMELAAACDLRFAATACIFGQPEIELGCYPPWAAAHYPQLLGLGNTADILLTGRTFDTDEAVRIGFVQRAVPAGDLDVAVDEFAAAITSRSVAVTRLAVRAIRARRDRGFDDALRESERLYTKELTRTADMTEGLSAFLEKRSPKWQNR